MAYARYTTKANLFGVALKGFPILFTGAGKVHWLSLNYFLYRLRSIKLSSISTYSGHLLDFFCQIELEGDLLNIESIESVDDDLLIAYKSALIDRDGPIPKVNTENYATQVLRTLLSFLMWLEDNNYTRNLIGETVNHRIRIKLTDKGHIKHPLTKITDNEKRASVTPRMEWIEMVKRYGPITANINARFELMIDWGRTVGLRAFEACYLTISQLPSRETAEKAIINGTNVYMLLIVTKGSKDKNIPISPLLVKKTWDYIDTTRKQVIATFKKRAKNKKTIYCENNYIFLSDKTGKALSPVSFSNSIRKAFLAAVDAGELTEDERVWCHGLRHYFTVTLLKFLDNKKVSRPEAVTRQVTRQGSDDALEPYLTDRFNEEFH